MTATAAQRTMLQRLFAAIDAQDIDAFLEHLAEPASFRFGSAPAVAGKPAIKAAVSGFFASISGLEHEIDLTIANGSAIVCEGNVTYTRHDGSRITLPFTDVFRMAGERIADYRIYMDVAPLYAD